MVYDTIIIGAGPAGLTASIYTSRYKLSNLVIGKLLGGTITHAYKVENFPGFISISGIELANKIVEQVKNLGTEILPEGVKEIVKNPPNEFYKIKSSLPVIEVSILKWIDKKDMTDEEKKEFTGYKTIGGYLKRLSYEDAWAETWSNMSDVDKNKITSIPQFDAQIFKDITGIDITADDEINKAIKALTDAFVLWMEKRY